jgi:hypothetical protein
MISTIFYWVSVSIPKYATIQYQCSDDGLIVKLPPMTAARAIVESKSSPPLMMMVMAP